MFLSILYLTFGLYVLQISSIKLKYDDIENMKAGKAPFFELPCMRVGGTCARGFACPPGTRVGDRGLCPDQQQFGMECCRPLREDLRCRARNGDCVPRTFKCPKSLRVKDTNDCGPKEICCMYVN